jgi:hypothetical protein
MQNTQDAINWLTAESALARVREATLVRASLISGEACDLAAVEWLESIAAQGLLKSTWAAQVLRTLQVRGLA